MKNKHIITGVINDSIAENLKLVPGDFLISVNGHEIEDVFDYRYLCQDSNITLVIEKADGSKLEYNNINKDEDEDIGLLFESDLMAEYRSCSNKCIFCFIDQLPKGMRETLYFKDDDMRLSFLQGNYVTLTNLSDNDIDRIIKYKLEPVNISFQTTDPELRCKMLNNRFAGESLKKAQKLYDNGITMNGQIVLCKGVNDGEQLEKSLSDLYKYVPLLESLSVVPVGLTKYRDGLYPLEKFTKEDAESVLETIKKWQDRAYSEHNTHFVHASDEWYILADRDLPLEDEYDGYLQIENGVGMLRSLITEFDEGLADLEWAVKIFISSEMKSSGSLYRRLLRGHFTKSTENEIEEKAGIINISSVIEKLEKGRTVSIATGQISYKYIKELADRFTDAFIEYGYKINVYPIRNDFLGENITVTGLLTGQDIVEQLKDKDLGDVLLLSENMLKANSTVLLDDMTVEDIEKSLHSKTCIVKSNGKHLIECIIGESIYV